MATMWEKHSPPRKKAGRQKAPAFSSGLFLCGLLQSHCPLHREVFPHSASLSRKYPDMSRFLTRGMSLTRVWILGPIKLTTKISNHRIQGVPSYRMVKNIGTLWPPTGF